MRKEATFAELSGMKFEVIERFGVTRNHRNYGFFIQETIEPTIYGADCQDATWYEVPLKDGTDLEALSSFLKNLFNVEIELTSNQEARETVNALNQDLTAKAEVIDWGACHVTHLPITEQFRKVGE